MPAGAILDTNIALDWLVFGDARVAPLVRAVTAGDLIWHGTPAMRDELAHVLHRPGLQRWKPDPVRVLDAFDRHVRLWPGGDSPGRASLRCRDGDDQKFIDLALAAEARWLFSHDRAVLDLACRARAFGLAIVTPAAWAASMR